MPQANQNALKQYLGDGVYADYDGYHIVLTTERLEPSFVATICLEPPVLAALNRYNAWLQEQLAKKP